MTLNFQNLAPRPGETVYGSLQLEGVHIPIVLAAGKEDGPALVLHCAQHQTEYAGSAMLGQLLAELDLRQLQGALVILPLVNIPMIVRNRLPETYLPQQQSNQTAAGTLRTNINRVWPGVKDGIWNEQLAYLLSHEVFAKCAAVIDFHSCRLCDPDFAGYAVTSPDSRSIALAFGLEAVDETPEEGYFPGQLHRRVPVELGVAAILVEMSPTSNQVGWSAMQRAKRGAFNVMRHLGMLPGKPELPSRQIVFHRTAEQFNIVAGMMGFVTTHQPPAAWVRQGQLIAEVRSLKDFAVLEEHRAGCDGGLASCGPATCHVILPGEEIATLQPGAEVIENH